VTNDQSGDSIKPFAALLAAINGNRADPVICGDESRKVSIWLPDGDALGAGASPVSRNESIALAMAQS
jgi:hypothetical protein